MSWQGLACLSVGNCYGHTDNGELWASTATPGTNMMTACWCRGSPRDHTDSPTHNCEDNLCRKRIRLNASLYQYVACPPIQARGPSGPALPLGPFAAADLVDADKGSRRLPPLACWTSREAAAASQLPRVRASLPSPLRTRPRACH